MVFFHNLSFFLNGQELDKKQQRADFVLHYDKPGVYPLNFTIKYHNWKTDSVRVWEKEYQVRVRE